MTEPDLPLSTTCSCGEIVFFPEDGGEAECPACGESVEHKED